MLSGRRAAPDDAADGIESHPASGELAAPDRRAEAAEPGRQRPIGRQRLVDPSAVGVGPGLVGGHAEAERDRLAQLDLIVMPGAI